MHAGSANICAAFVKMACGPEVGLGSRASSSAIDVGLSISAMPH